MKRFEWIILLIPISGVLSAIHEDSDGQDNPKPILPLTLLRVSANYLYPKYFQWIMTNNEGILHHGTEFSSWYDKDKNEQLLFCPSGSDQSGCLYPKEFKHHEILQCTDEPTPFIEKILDKSEPSHIKDISCGLADKKGVWYTTGYKICAPFPSTSNKLSTKILFRMSGSKSKPMSDCSQFNVFEFCYNEQSGEVLYTDYTIRSPRLLLDDRLKYEREKKFDISSERSEILGEIYQNNKVLLQQLEKSAQFSHTFEWLTPPEDLVFAIWKKTAYHTLNLKPMRKDQVELWNYLSKCIQRESIKKGAEFTIYTATLVLNGGKDPSYLIGSIEKPDLWIKVIYNFYTETSYYGDLHKCSALAIILNSNLDEKPWEDFKTKHCDEIICKNFPKEKFPGVAKSVHCCDMNYDLQRQFHLGFRLTGTLEMDFSSDDLSNTSDNQHESIHQT